MSYTRFALYAVPDQDWLADFGAKWLGWDLRDGHAVDHFPIAGLDDVTVTPRKYGFHGTIKPPFRLTGGETLQGLQQAVGALAALLPAVPTKGLRVEGLSGFLALRPIGENEALHDVAARCVTALDRFRAPASADELARRRAAGLTERQEGNLIRWGYPYVLDDFRFHFTLTGKLDADALAEWQAEASARLPVQPIPFALSKLALVGERRDGHFETLDHYTLTG
jgi:hypothetical protein